MARIPRKSAGTNTGLGVNECWIALFMENEKRHKLGGKPLPRTNPEISTFMANEFPIKDSAIYWQVSKVIWRYNNGRLYKDQPIPTPGKRAWRYNSKGERVTGKYFDPETD